MSMMGGAGGLMSGLDIMSQPGGVPQIMGMSQIGEGGIAYQDQMQ
jgi:hypothetical protein